MTIFSKREGKKWAIYFLTLFCGIYLHELGHCIPAWLNGLKAIPTPAKEYISGTISEELQQLIALGGIAGTVLFTVSILIFYSLKSFGNSSAVLAGALAMPGMYTLRFLIVGRGHDATEFQEAQAALSLSYSGHSLDWFLLFLLVAGIGIWILKSKPSLKIMGRLSIGFIVTVIFVIALQVVNNALFDPIFAS